MYSEVETNWKHVFIWNIENFRACTLKNGRMLESPVFVAESLDETSWSLLLYPRGAGRTSEGFISIFLKRALHCTGPDELKLMITFEISNGVDNEFRELDYEGSFKKGSSIGCKKFFFRPELDEYLNPFDTLTIRVTMRKMLKHFFTKNSCYTKIATDRFSFDWNIKKSISSGAETKSVSLSKDLQLEMKIEVSEEDVDISIRRVNGFINSEVLLCRATLLDMKGKDVVCAEAVFEADNPDDEDTWKLPTFLKKSKIIEDKDLRYYFTLRFYFSLSVGKTLDSMNNTAQCRFHLTKEDLLASLQKDLGRVFADRAHTDVELHVGEQVIPAHKVMLCARSPVFSAMFNQDMVENQTGTIHISDVDAETLNSLLEFMYTGDTELMDSEVALELLLAADKYQVSSLKEKCSSFLVLFLSEYNVCDVLYTADLIRQETLKMCAVDYIKQNPKNIFLSAEWKKLVDKNLKLASEVFCEVSTL